MDRPPLRLEYIDPATLDGHPANWKRHEPEQLGAIEDLFADVGWAGALLFNEQSGRLIDGHGRKQIFAGRGPVPVLIGAWSPEQEKKILAFLDPTGWMARSDARALALLTGASDLQAELDPGSERLKSLLDAVKASGELLDQVERKQPTDGTASDGAGGRAQAPKPPRAAETPDAIWPSDNPWGVPLLDLSMQADAVEFPVVVWGTQGQTKAMRGTWCFYTNDEAFDRLWSNPGKVFPSGAPCLVEPNYSTHDQTPFAVSLHGLYKRRWLARYWQSRGRRIFVDINVHHSLLAPHEATPGSAPAFLGVPKGWRAFATRAHGNRPEMLEAEWGACRAHAGTDSVLFLVYGGGALVKDLARANGWAWVPEQADTVRGRFLDALPTPGPAPAPVETEPCPST